MIFKNFGRNQQDLQCANSFEILILVIIFWYVNKLLIRKKEVNICIELIPITRE